jgi:1-deoxyxylulose-5-phosphate synthase
MIEELQISTIGLGTANFGRENDKAGSFALMDAAMARGVTLIDTAPSYSKGISEALVGEWWSSRRPPASTVIATKISPPYEPQGIMQSVESSLKRLRMKEVNILYLHNWHHSVIEPDVLRILDKLVESGITQTLGASNFSAEQLNQVIVMQKELGLAPFRFLQNNNNFAVNSVNDLVRNVCKAHEVKIITYSPLAAGFLTGKYKTSVPAGTRFEAVPEHKNIYFKSSPYERLQMLQSVALRTGYNEIQLALAWALHQPGISAVLVGGRHPSHIDQAFAALTTDIPDFFDL